MTNLYNLKNRKLSEESSGDFSGSPALSCLWVPLHSSWFSKPLAFTQVASTMKFLSTFKTPGLCPRASTLCFQVTNIASGLTPSFTQWNFYRLLRLLDFAQELAHSFSGEKNNLWAHPWFQHNEISVGV